MLESLVELVSGSPWTYALVLTVAALDALVPIVPSEATAIAAGVVAAAGELSLALVVAAAAAGAFAGDSSAYGVGRALGPRATRRLPERRVAWAEGKLRAHATLLILAARFVPGGRTVTMTSAGATHLPWLRFERLAAVAAVLWAAYAATLGYVGGRAFEEDPLKALLVGFGLAAGVAVAVEAGRRAVRAARRTSAG
jgi:membrane protein DedA with SNARE-associated domain